MNNEIKHFYRYRSNVDLDSNFNIFHELEQQEIYCASPKELNDPMEGSISVYWEGDNILWKNLIKNYLLSFLWTFEFFDEIELNSEQIESVFYDIDKCPLKFKNHYEHLCKIIFQVPELEEAPQKLEKLGKIGKCTLISVLTNISGYILNALKNNGFIHTSNADLSQLELIKKTITHPNESGDYAQIN